MQCKPIVKILADSISLNDIRIVTFQLKYWRAIHAEVMTHRVFSRNAGSSRARPVATVLEQVRSDPWGPEYWGENQPGMQARKEIPEFYLDAAKADWIAAANQAANTAELLTELDLHKQVVNRLLEPFSSIDVVLTSTEWNNFFELRCHKDAQPEIQTLASMMRDAMTSSRPKLLQPGEWHLPYISEADWADPFMDHMNYSQRLLTMQKASAARCARVSYKPFDANQSSLTKDMELFEKLAGSHPVHASPLEHQATPVTNSEVDDWRCGNFTGWKQFRHVPYKSS